MLILFNAGLTMLDCTIAAGRRRALERHVVLSPSCRSVC